MSDIKKLAINPPAQNTAAISVSDVTTYLAYLKHQDGETSSYMSYHRENPTDEPQTEPQVTEQVKQIALAIVAGLGGIEHFLNRSRPRWLFHGYAPLTEERQTDAAFFFYANKENFLALIKVMVETRFGKKKADLAQWLHSVNYDRFNAQLEARFNAIKAADSYSSIGGGSADVDTDAEPMSAGVTVYGNMITDMLFQMLQIIEVDYKNTYRNKPRIHQKAA